MTLTLQQILKLKQVNEKIHDFKITSDNIQESFSSTVIVYKDQKSMSSLLRKHKNTILISGRILLVLIFLCIAFQSNIKNLFDAPSPKTIFKEVTILKKDYYLSRPSILTKIHNILNKYNDINYIILVGGSGSGKTTIARQYSYNQKASIIWEINAQTTKTILRSFENLAYALCINSLDKEDFYNIQKQNSSLLKKKLLYSFLQKKLYKHPNWILIYDDVQNFRDIKNYLPRNPENWGKGKVIITTTNSNLSNNFIKINSILQIPELSQNEKLDLFNKILNIKNTNIKDIMELKSFLKKIPPFPSDISQAAFYIKNTNITYADYLNYKKTDKKKLIESQKSIIFNSNEYTKTREDIIESAIKKIISSDEQFRDLLKLISSSNSQYISKNLLVNYKGGILTNDFLYEMRKFSLITESNFSAKEDTFSIDYFTQKIIHNYFKENEK